MITVNHHTHWTGGRAFTQPPGPGAPWPGGEPVGPPAGPPADPYVSGFPAWPQSAPYPGLNPTSGANKPFGLSNLADLKLIIDRMGGIDGILNTVQKVQKIVGTVQQFAPMIKLLAGSLGPKKAAAASTNTESRPGRRRRRGGGRVRRGAARPRRGARRKNVVVRSEDGLF